MKKFHLLKVSKMALGASVSVTIDLDFNIQNIKLLLDKGQQQGYQYARAVLIEKMPDDEAIRFNLLPLTIEDILIGLETAYKKNDIFRITVCMGGASTGISFGSSNKKLSVGFFGVSNGWSVTNVWGEEDVNIQRYALTLLDLVKDYKLLNICIAKD